MEALHNDLKLSTTQALTMTSIDAKSWVNILQKKQYSEAPDMRPGSTRYFRVDDLVGLFIIDHFIRLGQTYSVAGRAASAVRREMKKHSDSLCFLWIIETPDRQFISVSARDPGPKCYARRIPISYLRRKIAALAAVIIARETT